MSCRNPRSPVLEATGGPPLDEVLVERRRRISAHEDDKRWLPPLPESVECDTPKPRQPSPMRARAAHRSRRYAALLCTALLMPLIGGHAWLCWSLARRERLHRWRYRGGGTGGGTGDGGAGAQGRAAIPRIIHQMYRTTELPEDWAHVPRAWKQLHADYQYMLWTDEQLRQLIAEDYPWLLATYDAYPHDTQRWDASRFAILHKYGGVYADLDIQARALRPAPVRAVRVLLRPRVLCACTPARVWRRSVARTRTRGTHGAHTVHTRCGARRADVCTAAPCALQAVERIDALLEGQQLLLPHTPNVGLTNALMASVAAHPFMGEALRLLPAYAHAWCTPPS